MANYNQAIEIILKNEGGYQEHPNDKGNYNSKGLLVGTNHGISAPTLERWKGRTITQIEMKQLSLREAKEIYKKYYWLPIWGENILDQDNAEIIFDHSVNAGVGSASILVQKTLNGIGSFLVLDGAIGKKTITELNKTNQHIFFNEFRRNRIEYYKSISGGSNSVFARGWIKRVIDFKKKRQLLGLVY